MAKAKKIGRPFEGASDPRRWKGGKPPSLPAQVRRWLGDNTADVAETFGHAILTGRLSFEHIRGRKVRRIDTADLPEPRTLTPEQYLQFVNAAGLIPKGEPIGSEGTIVVKLGKAEDTAQTA